MCTDDTNYRAYRGGFKSLGYHEPVAQGTTGDDEMAAGNKTIAYYVTWKGSELKQKSPDKPASG